MPESYAGADPGLTVGGVLVRLASHGLRAS